jgi:hypothetical protein
LFRGVLVGGCGRILRRIRIDRNLRAGWFLLTERAPEGSRAEYRCPSGSEQQIAQQPAPRHSGRKFFRKRVEPIPVHSSRSVSKWKSSWIDE